MKKNKMKYEIKNIFFLIRPICKYGKLYIILSLFSAILIAPLSPISYVLLTQKTVDLIATKASFKEIVLMICVLYGINMAVWLFRTGFRELYLDIKKSEIQSKINKDLYMKMISTDYKYFDQSEFFDNYTWASSDFARKSFEALEMLLNLLTAFFTIIALCSIIATTRPFILLLVIMQLIATTIIEMKRNSINIKQREELIPFERKINYVHRTMFSKECVQDIKSTRVKDFLIKMLDDNVKHKLNKQKKYVPFIFLNSILNVLIAFLTEGSIMIYICYGIIVSQSIMGAGMFLGLFYASQNLVGSLQDFFGVIVKTNELSLYAEKIKGFYNLPSTIEYISELPINKQIKEECDENISLLLKNVSFFYPNSQFGLKNINMQIKKGEKVAIVGENGAGKSTLIKLLLRLYDADNGEIYYNGKLIKEYDVYSLRDKIGIAFQSPQVYAFPFIQNIQIYRNISEDNVTDLLNKTDLLKVFSKCESDYNTEMTREFDSKGIMVSGGEAQKIAIARVLAAKYSKQKFGLMLFDEPSSSLDPIAEYELNKMIFDASNTATTIIISHRLSTIRDADKIYVFKNGEIIECGTHSMLMKNGGEYYQMFTTQAENYLKESDYKDDL